MALIVEDGTGLSNAESYCSVAEADDYHTKRGNVAWDAVDDKEAALRLATEYMLEAYRRSWKGFRVYTSQALDWPRACVPTDNTGLYGGVNYLANNIVPPEVKKACAELALRSTEGELNPDLERGVLSESVGPLSVTYDQNSPQQKRYRKIDMLLGIYICKNGINAGVVR